MADDDIAEQLVKLLVVTNGKLQVTGNNTLLLVIPSSVTRKFEDLSSKIFKNSSEVNRSTCSHTLCVVALLQETVDTTDRELETSLCRTRLRLARFTSSLTRGRLASFTLARHFKKLLMLEDKKDEV